MPTCGICLDAFRTCTRGRLDSCSHLFCRACITTWSKRENTCPVCKRRFHRIYSSGGATRVVSNKNQRRPRTSPRRRPRGSPLTLVDLVRIDLAHLCAQREGRRVMEQWRRSSTDVSPPDYIREIVHAVMNAEIMRVLTHPYRVRPRSSLGI
jgi:hypothetical protein